jgi:3-deoxy-D-manno-octulosonic acid kinase
LVQSPDLDQDQVSTHDRIWGAAPGGFNKVVLEPHRRLLLRADVADELQICMSRVENHLGEPSRFIGREALRTVSLKNGENALIRAYHHGGLFRWISGKTFFSRPPRPFRELAITEELRRRGLPTVEVYGACVEVRFGPFYHGWLITQELKGSYDLWTALQNGFVHKWTAEKVFRSVASSLRSLHRQGVYHNDLNLKNILVRAEPAGVKGYIIDFDKAMLFLGGLPEALAEKNLRRLLRSVRKLDPQRQYLTAADWDDLVTWYHEADRV